MASSNLPYTFGIAENHQDLKAILDLQKANLEVNISEQELKEQGFVTVHHSLGLLQEMNASAPQIVAKDENEVVAYALAMLASFRDQIPVLVPMFEMIEKLEYKGAPISDFSYFIMGQVANTIRLRKMQSVYIYNTLYLLVVGTFTKKVLIFK